MKAINIKGGRVIDLKDRQPCWYATLTENVWSVGVKKPDAPGEIKLNIKKYNLDWATATSLEFAIKLIDLYKKGQIKSWINGGCK